MFTAITQAPRKALKTARPFLGLILNLLVSKFVKYNLINDQSCGKYYSPWYTENRKEMAIGAYGHLDFRMNEQHEPEKLKWWYWKNKEYPKNG